MTTSVIVEGETTMRDYLITIATATLMALVLQHGSAPPAAPPLPVAVTATP